MPPKTEQPAGTAPAGTEGESSTTTTPPATQTPPSAPAAIDPSKPQVPEGFELIRTEDKNNLISQRDKAKNNGSQDSALLNALVQKDAVRDAMSTTEFKDKYPDVTESDIMDANPMSDEEIEAVAKNRQERFESVKQAHIRKIQGNTTAPTLSPEDKQKQLDDLSKPGRPANAFQRGLQLMRAVTK